ncbi:hypothetical protein C0991_003510, partial [Blastosporella zonata]
EKSIGEPSFLANEQGHEDLLALDDDSDDSDGDNSAEVIESSEIVHNPESIYIDEVFQRANE